MDKIINFNFNDITPSFTKEKYYDNDEFLNDMFVNSVNRYIDGLSEFNARCINLIGTSGNVSVATDADIEYRRNIR